MTRLFERSWTGSHGLIVLIWSFWWIFSVSVLRNSSFRWLIKSKRWWRDDLVCGRLILLRLCRSFSGENLVNLQILTRGLVCFANSSCGLLSVLLVWSQECLFLWRWASTERCCLRKCPLGVIQTFCFRGDSGDLGSGCRWSFSWRWGASRVFQQEICSFLRLLWLECWEDYRCGKVVWDSSRFHQLNCSFWVCLVPKNFWRRFLDVCELLFWPFWLHDWGKSAFLHNFWVKGATVLREARSLSGCTGQWKKR